MDESEMMCRRYSYGVMLHQGHEQLFDMWCFDRLGQFTMGMLLTYYLKTWYCPLWVYATSQRMKFSDLTFPQNILYKNEDWRMWDG